jgi:hypothetical protein
MLADIPELDRDVLLNRLAKRLATAEGLPARLPIWAVPRKVPVRTSGGQPQSPTPYAQYASPTSMEFEHIPDAYWLEVLRDQVEVVFDQNAVFWGECGYLHVRISQQHDDSITSTGMPGRPSMARDLIDDEFQRRVDADECELSTKGEAGKLLGWLKKKYPGVPRPTQKTIENNIRKGHRSWRGRTQRSTK